MRRWAAVAAGLMFAGCVGATADCTLTETQRTPLNDLGPALYGGFDGGLYPHGSNQRPAAHRSAGLEIAATQIVPRDADGSVNTNSGKVVMISIGMSNTTQEFATGSKEGGGISGTFKARADADPAKNPRLVIVDGAQGGRDATAWTNINAITWSTVDQRLTAAGVTSNQVQVAWVKQALAQVGSYGAFPAHAQKLQAMLGMIARNAKTRYPNLRLMYVSSRTRAYTAVPTALNPEPFAYEAAWATKWVIQDQINGVNDLNFDPNRGPVVAPWLSWGPYLWADGTTPRSDGFVWLCSDVRQDDFTHPGSNGVSKVGRQLLAFFKTDPTATPWFLKQTAAPLHLSAAASLDSGPAPLVVHFTAFSTNSSAQFAWTFDDGGFSDAQNPTKTFPAPGVYEVHLTAEDLAGNTALTTLVINVTAPPFAVTAIRQEGNDIRIAWTSLPGQTNALERTAGVAGSFTNNFTVLTNILTTGMTTNVLDLGAATNAPALFYRVRIVP